MIEEYTNEAYELSLKEKDRRQGIVDPQMASPVRHGRPLDKSRRCRARKLAAMDERLKGLLKHSLAVTSPVSIIVMKYPIPHFA